MTIKNENITPIAVDLDGTLIKTDVLHETALQLMTSNPLEAMKMPLWLLSSKAALKNKIAERVDLIAEELPYNQDVLNWLKARKEEGRPIYLATASHEKYAHQIAEYLGIFDGVIASNETINMKGHKKAEELVKRFGEKGFDYVGDQKADLPIWKCAATAYSVNADNSVKAKLDKSDTPHIEICHNAPSARDFIKMIRVHQWLKNILIFVPVIIAHRMDEPTLWLLLGLAFLAASFGASAIYILNDLLDLSHDRAHKRKRNRPLAAGKISVPDGILTCFIMFAASLGIASLLNSYFLVCLITYFIITTLYSFVLKRVVILDCIILSILYTIRIVMGTLAININFSFWLLAFSVFIFVALAFLKRFTELKDSFDENASPIAGRGYLSTDLPLIMAFGVGASFASVLVLVLYLNSDVIKLFYETPEIAWGIIPVIIYWQCWMWLKAHRGEMHDDPLVFTAKDKNSLISFLIIAIFFAGATTGLPW